MTSPQPNLSQDSLLPYLTSSCRNLLIRFDGCLSIRREHFIWLIPIVVGAATYWRAEAMHRAVDVAEVPGRSSDGIRGNERRLSSAADLDAEIDKVRAEMLEVLNQDAPQIPPMDVERLKEEILSLRKRMDEAMEAKDEFQVSRLIPVYVLMWNRLGENAGKENAEWVRVNFPNDMERFLEGWAKAKPEEALRYIEGATQPGICSLGMVMELLDRLGKDDPNALKSAARRVPWDLFLFEGKDPLERSGYGMRPLIPDTENPAVWWESGVARELAEEGVHIRGLFLAWAQENPQEAMFAWIGWPGQERDERCEDLFTILMLSVGTEERYGQLKKDLLKLDPGDLAKIRSAFGRLQEIHSPALLYQGGAVEKIGELLESSASPP